MVISRELYPLVIVDVALFCIEDDCLKVLLVKRAEAPEKHKWALPGGMVKPDVDDSLEGAARRVLNDKVSVDIAHLEQVCTFSGPKRDPRGWSVANLLYALLPSDMTHALVRKKIEAVKWTNVSELGGDLAFDHESQLNQAVLRLRAKVEAHALPLHLMPEKFTLTELQRTCEAILGHPIDKSVFRRRLKGSADLVELEEFERGQQRPARLFQACADFKFGCN